MKFVPPGDTPIMIALTSGHTTVVHHTPEGEAEGSGTDLHPRFRKEAIKRGCIPVGLGAVEDESEGELDRNGQIKKGINTMLDSDDETAFTADGKPDVRKLSSVVGFTVSREERDAAWAGMKPAQE